MSATPVCRWPPARPSLLWLARTPTATPPTARAPNPRLTQEGRTPPLRLSLRIWSPRFRCRAGSPRCIGARFACPRPPPSVRLTRAPTTTRSLSPSLPTAKPPGTDASYNPVISPDGQYVAFVSFATNLVSNITRGRHQSAGLHSQHLQHRDDRHHYTIRHVRAHDLSGFHARWRHGRQRTKLESFDLRGRPFHFFHLRMHRISAPRRRTPAPCPRFSSAARASPRSPAPPIPAFRSRR